MFVREKVARGHRYLYLVESIREGGRVRQQIVGALGRKDALLESGELDRLIASLARHSERAMILSDMEAGQIACTRIGGPLLFGRLWERLSIPEVLADLLASRGFEFSVERAVFVSVLHRLFVSGSDRSCETWMADYAIPGAANLQLHHFYRAMAWLGEETAPIAVGALAPRCVKDLIEERLFERRRDLFSELSLVFMDTTTLTFEGDGGETLGAHGHSKDHRPALKQMVLAVVMDAEGRPICTEMLPGNTADVTRAAADHGAPARALYGRPDLRRRRPRHDRSSKPQGPAGPQAGIRSGCARAVEQPDPQGCAQGSSSLHAAAD
jgi:hypothetical protein